MDISELLKQKNITKAELANRLGIHNQNVNKLLANPTEANIIKIADALGVSVGELFGESPNKPTNNDFAAFVRSGGKCYYRDSLSGLEELIQKLKCE